MPEQDWTPLDEAAVSPTVRRQLVFSASELIREAKPPKWIVQKLLPEASLIIFAGLAKKAKKTFTALELAKCVAQGKPFLGMRSRVRPVHYVFLEDGANRAGQRLKMLGLDSERDTELRFHASFGDDGLAETVARISKSTTPCLWIVDPLVELETIYDIQDENSAIEISKMLKKMRAICQRTGSTLLLLHHFEKTGQRARGSSAIQGACDGWIDAFPVGEDRIKWQWTMRDADDGGIGLEAKINHRSGCNEPPESCFNAGCEMLFRPIALEELPDRSPEGRKQSYRDRIHSICLQQAQPGKPWIKAEICRKLGYGDDPKKSGSISKVIDSMHTKGELEMLGSGLGYRSAPRAGKPSVSAEEIGV